MAIHLGSGSSRVTLRQALLVHLVLALVLWGVATAQGQPVRASLQGLYVDVGAKRIVATVIAIGAGAGAEARLTATIDARAAQGEQ